ncbi:hypothetical protein [uncultured Ruegeria sp.]|uniref:hypothetical protein n=1 Tax=uncultured Ruegeria sp. TaxID=259304 RepID=UPI002616B618|nr:hypothetical protein [uncultured Ruegeria sp.]
MAIVPIGFCFPRTGKAGDLSPRAESASAWRNRILESLSSLELTLIIGRYALDWHLPVLGGTTVTAAVRSWKDVLVAADDPVAPSPRNNRWLKYNPWFEQGITPVSRERVQQLV